MRKSIAIEIRVSFMGFIRFLRIIIFMANNKADGRHKFGLKSI